MLRQAQGCQETIGKAKPSLRSFHGLSVSLRDAEPSYTEVKGPFPETEANLPGYVSPAVHNCCHLLFHTRRPEQHSKMVIRKRKCELLI